MTITDLMPTVKELSHTDKLLLLQVLVQELLQSEGINKADHSDGSNDISTSAVEEAPLTLEDRLAFLKKPLAERRAIMAAQAEVMVEHYEKESDWRELMAGDIVEY